MNNKFTRGKDPQESMGIGIKGNSISIKDIEIELDIYHYTPDGMNDSTFYVLKRRNLISLSSIIPLLNRDKISFNKLFKYFKLKTGNCLDSTTLKIEEPFAKLRDWHTIRKASRSEDKEKYALILLDDESIINERTPGKYYKNLFKFRILSSDLQKAKEIQAREEKIKGVIFKDKIYPIFLGSKYLVKK